VTADEPARPAQKITTVEACRGLAAMLVVLYHASGGAFEHYFGYRPTSWFQFGRAGVDFFFVLSGFIILHVHFADIGRPDRWTHFAWRRVMRIYPVYWIVTLIVLIAALAIPAMAAWAQMEPAALVKSFLLWPQAHEPLVTVAWTLEHEMLFYTLFGIAVLSRGLGMAVLALWLVAILAAFAWPQPSSIVLRFVTSPYNFEFFIGMGAALLLRRGPVPAPILAVGLGAAMFLATGTAENMELGLPGPTRYLGYAIGAALVLLGLAELERSRGWRAPAVLVLLGASSYSIYLVHLNAVILSAKILAWLGAGLMVPKLVLFGFVVAAGTAAGLVFYLLIERPLLAFLRTPRRMFGSAAERHVLPS
jgi:peptidoglycan/LPS O-acetylase OafA/YrhL